MIIVEHVFNIPHILNIATTIWTLRDGRIAKETPDKLRQSTAEASNSQFIHWLSDGIVKPIVSETELPGGAVLSTIASADTDNNPITLEIKDLVVYRDKRMVIGEQTTDGKIKGLSFTLKKRTVNGFASA